MVRCYYVRHAKLSFLLIIFLADYGLIPREPKAGCPKEKVNNSDFSTCSCEDHCRWDVCRLSNPSKDCLLGTNSEWKWDTTKAAWVARNMNGNIYL